ncbi:MAG: alpha/beta hydrolase [Lachnospiraceae bacterium]|nr:alpha/beta hydrolase [Lachnospiraceae bacterium]
MYIQLNSQVIYYEHLGEGQKPLILLHGNGEDHTVFEELIKEIEPDFDIYALDSRGQGLSATPKEYHYKDMAEDVLNFISSLSLKSPAIFGFSDGGIISLLAEIASPGSFTHIIAAGANTTPDALSFGSRREIKREFKKTGNLLSNLMLTEPHISEEELSTISCPTLLLGGQKDLISSKEFKKMNSAIKHSQLEILSGEDHGSYVIHSAKTASFIKSFIFEEVF